LATHTQKVGIKASVISTNQFLSYGSVFGLRCCFSFDFGSLFKQLIVPIATKSIS